MIFLAAEDEARAKQEDDDSAPTLVEEHGESKPEPMPAPQPAPGIYLYSPFSIHKTA